MHITCRANDFPRSRKTDGIRGICSSSSFERISRDYLPSPSMVGVSYKSCCSHVDKIPYTQVQTLCWFSMNCKGPAYCPAGFCLNMSSGRKNKMAGRVCCTCTCVCLLFDNLWDNVHVFNPTMHTTHPFFYKKEEEIYYAHWLDCQCRAYPDLTKL